MKKRVIHTSLAILIGIFVPIILAEIALQIIGVYGGLQQQRVDKKNPIRRYVPNQEFYYTFGPFFESRNSGVVNNYGFVNDQPYHSEGRLPLLAIVGDSFVEAIMVPYSETTHGRLVQDLSGRARVYSFGMLSNALSDYLAYAEYLRDVFRPAGLVVVVVGNDFDQSLTLYRDAAGYHGYVPLPDGQFRHKLNEHHRGIIKRTIYKSALFRYLFIHLRIMQIYGKLFYGFDYIGNTRADYDDKRLRLSKQFVDFFLTKLPESAGLPTESIVLVLDGIRPELYCDECLEEVEDSYFSVMRSYLAAQAAQRGYEVVDMQPIFQESYRRTRKRFEPKNDGHWNSRGHEEVAAAVLGTRAIARHWPVGSRAGSE